MSSFPHFLMSSIKSSCHPFVISWRPHPHLSRHHVLSYPHILLSCCPHVMSWHPHLMSLKRLVGSPQSSSQQTARQPTAAVWRQGSCVMEVQSSPLERPPTSPEMPGIRVDYYRNVIMSSCRHVIMSSHIMKATFCLASCFHDQYWSWSWSQWWRLWNDILLLKEITLIIDISISISIQI